MDYQKVTPIFQSACSCFFLGTGAVANQKCSGKGFAGGFYFPAGGGEFLSRDDRGTVAKLPISATIGL